MWLNTLTDLATHDLVTLSAAIVGSVIFGFIMQTLIDRAENPVARYETDAEMEARRRKKKTRGETHQ